MGKGIRADEEWARQIIEAHLDRPVEHNDDESRNSMYDLRVGHEDNPEIAIECVKDAETATVRVWKKGPANGCLRLETKGDWVVELTSAARIDAIRAKLGPLLAKLHAVRTFSLDFDVDEAQASLSEDFERQGVSAADCFHANGKGRVYFSMSLPGGIADPSGTELSKWVTGFVNSERHRDNLIKLGRSGAKKRHLFIILTFMEHLVDQSSITLYSEVTYQA